MLHPQSAIAFAITAIAGSVLMIGPAQAQDCTLESVTIEGARVSVAYDPFSPSGPAEVLPLQIRTSGDCSGRQIEIAVTPESSNPSPTSLLLYNSADTLPLQIEDRNGRSLVALGGLNFAPGRVARMRLTSEGNVTRADALVLGVTPGQAVRSGEYLGRAAALVRLLDSADEPLAAPFDVVALVSASVGLAAASDLRIDLGELSDGAQSQTRFVVYANTDYELSIRSDNGWRLRQNAEGAGVPYQLSVSGRAAQGAPDTTLAFNRPRSDGRRVHEMNVMLAPPEGAPAGRYHDFITIEISARL